MSVPIGVLVAKPSVLGARPGVLDAKPGRNGHKRDAHVIACKLRDAGMRVSYRSLRKAPEVIVIAALRQDDLVVGRSIVSGAHNVVVPRLIELLRSRGSAKEAA